MDSMIIGHVDGLAEGSLTGWVVDLEQPDKLEQVICRGVDGSALTFTAFLHRGDVCDGLSRAGRFGFAIPLHLLESLGSAVTVTDRNGVHLPPQQTLELPTRAGTQPRCVFLHIPKTAGTSLRAVLARAVKPGEALYLYEDGNGLLAEEVDQLTPAQRSALKLVIGHVYFGIGRLLPDPVKYVTFLRDPKERLRSNFYHHAQTQADLRINNEWHDIVSVVQQGLNDEFDNLMVRMIAGQNCDAVPIGLLTEAHVDIALSNIRNHFSFVGLTEQIDEHYPAMCRAVGLAPFGLPHDNLRGIADTSALDARIDWDDVMHRNRFDQLLYDRAQAEGLCGRPIHSSCA